MRKIKESEVVFTVTAEAEDTDPADHFASGDDEQDKAMVAEIHKQLRSGDEWAWFCAKVTATLTLPDGSKIEGVDYLGGCSYTDEKDFKQSGGYYDDMKVTALADLQRQIEAEVARGKQLAEWFREPRCGACGKILSQCNEEPACSETNNYEHDIPGHRLTTTITRP